MPGIEGRLFGPNLANTGVAATACWQGDALRVHYDGRDLLASELRIRAGGFNDQQLCIDWVANSERFSFVVSAEDAKAELLRLAPLVHAQALARTLGAPMRARRHFVAAWAVIATIAVALSVLAIFALSRASTKLAALVPKEHEAMLGRVVLEQTRLTHRVFDQGPLVDAVSAVGSLLVSDSEYHYQWYVSVDPELNAFAAPGGVVVVTSGLLAAADSAEELAGVLGHEVAHTELRHTTASLIKSLGLRSLFGLIFGGIHPEAGNVFARFTELKFSRDAERDADREGLKRLRAARIETDGMLHMFEKLARQNASGHVNAPDFLSTHPDIQERIAWLRQNLRESPRAVTVPLKTDWSVVRHELEKIRGLPEPESVQVPKLRFW